MANVKRGHKIVYKLQSNGLKYRYDFDMGGMKGIVIVDPASGQTAILMPEEKYVHYTKTSSRISRSNDPVQSLMSMRDSYSEKKLGKE